MASFVFYSVILLALSEVHIGPHTVFAASYVNCSESNSDPNQCEFCHCNPNNLATTVQCHSWGACGCKLDDPPLASNNLLPPYGPRCKKQTSGDCKEACKTSDDALDGFLCEGNKKLCYCGRKAAVSDFYGCREPEKTYAGYLDPSCPVCNCGTNAKATGCYKQVCRCDSTKGANNYLKPDTTRCKKAAKGGFCEQNCTKDYDAWICPGFRLPVQLCYCSKK